jgi:tRNA U34 5-carboxymethylaminomethyl modifying enzyme MnmG/GidA
MRSKSKIYEKIKEEAGEEFLVKLDKLLKYEHQLNSWKTENQTQEYGKPIRRKGNKQENLKQIVKERGEVYCPVIKKKVTLNIQNL